ncbi:MAG: hypothetical protein J6T70_04670 [Bacteroidales bacterium]|nr:hypothetical protein [Bacteroidales bacterium]
MLVLKNFDKYLYTEFIGKENETTISAGIIGTDAGSFFINKAIELYDSLTFDINNLQKLSIPQNLTKIINEMEPSQRPKIYPSDVFYPLPMEATVEGNFNYKPYLTNNSVAVHLWNASWLDELNEYRKQSSGIRKYWNIIKAHIIK